MRQTLICCGLILWAISSFAQGAMIDGTSMTTAARYRIVAVPGSQITLCQFPAQGQSPTSPCTNKATVYTNVTLATPSSSLNPVIVNSRGYFGFWTKPGAYDYSVCRAGFCYGPYHIWTGLGFDSSRTAYLWQPLNMEGFPIVGPTTLSGSTAADIFNGVCGVGTGASAPKYASLAAAVADSNCTTIEVAAKSGCYSESWTSSLAVHGTLVIRFKGCATINVNGNNSLNLGAGGPTQDNFSIYSDFPTSAHGDGSNSGVTFTGYTGTGCVICIGNGTGPATATLNTYIRGINFDLSAAGSGAVGWKLLNVQQFTVADVWCSLIAAGSGCGLLDGTGVYTGVGLLLNINFTGNTGANQFGIRGQNQVTDTIIQGGNGNLNGANGICYDAENSTEFHFDGANCNGASQAIKEVGAVSRLTGWIRIDSGVVSFGTITSGAFQVFCANCSISTPFTDSTGNASFLTADSLALNGTKWRLVCTSTSCSIKDVSAKTAPFSCITGGNCFLGEAANQPILDNNGGLTLQGVTSSTVKDVVPSVVGGSFTITKPGATGTYLVTGNGASPIQTMRVSGCKTRAAQFNTCDTTVTWTTAFADANYTAVCVGDVVTNGVPQIEGIDISAAKTGSAITVRTIALTAAAAQFTTIDCTAVHD